MSKRIALGARVRDELTGFEGHATARVEHLHGVPELKVIALRDGAIYAEWIDEARCVAVAGDADARCGFETAADSLKRAAIDGAGSRSSSRGEPRGDGPGLRGPSTVQGDTKLPANSERGE